MSSNERSVNTLTVKRIVIFCVIALLPLWIIIPILNGVFGEMLFVSQNAVTAAYVIGVFGMFVPALANLFTRLITKEGFKNSYLGLNIEGNKKYYIASIVVKIAETSLCIIFIWALFANNLSFGEAFFCDNMNLRTGTFLLQIAASVIMFFPAFGEEWGWRGYLMPKLMEVIGKPAAIVVGGVLWGLWHAPLTISGHNFGVGYDFYPWLGILLMCVMCVLMNAFLTLLTERTKSIYPASFCHMINNNLSSFVMMTIFGSESLLVQISSISPITLIAVYIPILAVTGVVSFILLMKKEKTE